MPSKQKKQKRCQCAATFSCFLGCCDYEYAADFAYTPAVGTALPWAPESETDVLENWLQSFVRDGDASLTFNSFIGPAPTITVDLPLSKPARISDVDAAINHQFRINPSCRIAEAVERVLRGLKPVTQIVLKARKYPVQVDEALLLRLTQAAGLQCTVLENRWTVRVALVYRADLTLADFYDQDAVIRLYAGIGVRLEPDAFRCSLGEHVQALCNERFTEGVVQHSYPMIGLCYGYSIGVTLAVIS